MNEHADLELIAAFREGLLGHADGDRVGRHLSGCGACAQRHAALAEVTARLAQAPPPPLPPGLAQRLDAVLTAEVAAAGTTAGTTAATGNSSSEQRQQRARHGLRAARSRAGQRPADRQPAGRAPAGPEHAGRAPAGREPTGRGPAGRKRAGGERARHGLMASALRPLAAAAFVCLLAGGGYLLVRSSAHTSSGSAAAAGHAGRQAGMSSAAASSRTPMFAPQIPGATETAAFVSSKTRYQPGQLREQAMATARKYAKEIPSPSKAGDTSVQPSRENSSLSGCARRVTDGRRGLIVDTATYQGHPATVIIAPGTAGAAGQVWVVRPGCSESADSLIISSRL